MLQFVKVIPLFKNETLLVSRAIKYNREAQRLLYEKYSGKMLSVCRMYIKDVHEAEEVMLNGFFKVFTHLKDFKNEGSFEGWIRKIMVRESLSFYVKKRKSNFRKKPKNIPKKGLKIINPNLKQRKIQS